MDLHPNDTAIPQTQTIENEFGHLYITVRQRERRLYTDEEVRRLPDIDPLHIHYSEWKIRKRSAEKLINHLNNKKKPLSILEIGCGNGWLSAQLAQINGAIVTGLDVNEIEIAQAKRVFTQNNLQFFCDEFDAGKFKTVGFDAIVFAASLQYFNPVGEVLDKALSCLNPSGEIHIVDTKFYTLQNVNGAAQRTLQHYANMGCPELAAYYFHHQMNDLKTYNHKVLSNPNSILNRLQKGSPFYWIRINN